MRCPGKVKAFVHGSLLILVVKRVTTTCPAWILGINESVTVEGILTFTKTCPLYRDSKQASLTAMPEFLLS